MKAERSSIVASSTSQGRELRVKDFLQLGVCILELLQSPNFRRLHAATLINPVEVACQARVAPATKAIDKIAREGEVIALAW